MRWYSVGWWVVAACGADPEPMATASLPEVDCAASPLSWENAGGPILIGYCTPCHSSRLASGDRQAAPNGVDFDTVELARPFGERIVERVVTSMDMPPGGALPDDEQLRLLDWVACGMP
ncbi:MAG: hypothetical protein AAGA48_24115 [Myxococcota bacterium]